MGVSAGTVVRVTSAGAAWCSSASALALASARFLAVVDATLVVEVEQPLRDEDQRGDQRRHAEPAGGLGRVEVLGAEQRTEHDGEHGLYPPHPSSVSGCDP
jgi:hypothetical protein